MPKILLWTEGRVPIWFITVISDTPPPDPMLWRRSEIVDLMDVVNVIVLDLFYQVKIMFNMYIILLTKHTFGWFEVCKPVYM